MSEFGFYIKKFITFFVEPLGLVMTFFVLGLFFFYKNKRLYSGIFLSISFVLLALFSYQPFSNLLLFELESGYKMSDHKKEVRYIHVLGGGHSDEEERPLSSQLSNASVKRVLEGIMIHLKTPNSKIIFTGYEGDTDTPNAMMGAKLAAALGVKEENIITGTKPKDTYEEAMFVKEIVKEEPFILVTSASHMPRAMRLFRSAGMNPIAAPTDFHSEEYDFFEEPRIHWLENSRIAVHEYIGILWSMIKK